MAFDKTQFRDLIHRVLKEFDLPRTNNAIELLLATAAQESHFGTYLRQLRGPAIGVFQMEPETFEWLQQKYAGLLGPFRNSPARAMEYNLRLAIVMARLRYLAIPEALPTDLEGMARYWKKFYNTELGAGTVEEFYRNYAVFVDPNQRIMMAEGGTEDESSQS